MDSLNIFARYIIMMIMDNGKNNIPLFKILCFFFSHLTDHAILFRLLNFMIIIEIVIFFIYKKNLSHLSIFFGYIIHRHIRQSNGKKTMVLFDVFFSCVQKMTTKEILIKWLLLLLLLFADKKK